MNTKISKTVGLLAVVVLLSACGFQIIRGSGDLVTETRSVSNFDRVSLSGSGEVIVTQSGTESLTIETDDNVIEHVTTEVRGGTLYLGFDTTKVKSFSPSRLRFDLNVKDLVGVKISGSGDITAASLDTDRLDVGVSGSGDIQIDSLTADEVEVQISGSGNVELAGEATGQDITITGSGEFHAGDLRGETVEITISGSGSATIWVIQSLDARISGSGSVNYYGSPTVDSSGSGSGKIRGLGEK